MGELIDKSVELVVTGFMAAPLSPEGEAEPGECPHLPSTFSGKFVEGLDRAGRVALFLEMLDDPHAISLHRLENGVFSVEEILEAICEVFLESKASELPEVASRYREQWDRFDEAHPELA